MSVHIRACVRALTVATLLPLGSTCSGPTHPSIGDTPDPKGIELPVASMTIWQGGSDSVRAHVFATSGYEIPVSVQWLSDDPTIASVNYFGVIRGVAAGHTRITASYRDVSSTMTVEVLGVDSITSVGLSELLVNQSAVLSTTVRASDGQTYSEFTAKGLTFTTSDTALLQLHSDGIAGTTIRGLHRGDGTVTVRVGGVTATLPMRVRAKVRLGAYRWHVDANGFPLENYGKSGAPAFAVGDTLLLSATYVDVDGISLDDPPKEPKWTTDRPATLAVSSDGLLTALTAGWATVHVETPDDSTSVLVGAWDFRQGQSASIRFAHAMPGVGPITFTPDSGAPVTLHYGESAERSVLPGTYRVRASGIPEGAASGLVREGTISDGDHLTIYATPVVCCEAFNARLVGGWSRSQSIPQYLGLVRVVQASGFHFYVLRPRGTWALGHRDGCDGPPGYLYAGDVQMYSVQPAGSYDLILLKDAGDETLCEMEEITRMPLEVLPGQAITAVVFGSTAADARVLPFVDN